MTPNKDGELEKLLEEFEKEAKKGGMGGLARSVSRIYITLAFTLGQEAGINEADWNLAAAYKEGCATERERIKTLLNETSAKYVNDKSYSLEDAVLVEEFNLKIQSSLGKEEGR